MDVTKAVVIGCEVGVENAEGEKGEAVASFTDSTIDVALTKRGSFGTIKEILQEYGLKVDDLPKYFKDAFNLEARIEVLKYKSEKIGTWVKGDSNGKITDKNGVPLDGMSVVVPTGGQPSVVGPDQTTKMDGYDVQEEDENKYRIGRVTYTFIITARYNKTYFLVPRILGLKFLAFAITNDPAFTKKEGELQEWIKSIVPEVKPSAELPG